MALTASITLNASTVQAGQPARAVLTISNSDIIPVTIATLRPTVIQTGDPITEDASSVAKAVMPLLQAFNNQVPASGSADFPFSFNCQTPSTSTSNPSGTYDVSCQIEAADGQNLSPTAATITVTPVT